MILQALKEYYERRPDLARQGFEEKEIPYLLTLQPDGTPIGLFPTYEGIGKKRRAKKFLVPQAVKRSVGILANLLWDNPEYVFGISLKGNSERTIEQHAAFQKRIEELGNIDDVGLNAVRRFMSKTDKISLLENFGDAWSQLCTEGSNLTFQLAGDENIILHRPLIREAIQKMLLKDISDERITCLITGEQDVVERLHTSIKGVWGAQSSGANIVAFNQNSFKSFGKEQGANAPIGKVAAFAYTTALNILLSKDSKQRMQIGDTSTVYWSEKPTQFEEKILDFFGEPPKDDPDRGVRSVESLFSAVKTGAFLKENGSTKFYVLGLAPNASRIAIRFWIVATVSEMAGKICQHFEDIKITHTPHEGTYLSLFRLLVSTAAQGKSENIPPNLAGGIIRSILEGLPYPKTLLYTVLRRIRAEQSKKDKNSGKQLPNVTYERAALIKACLNRELRFYNQEKEELKMSLDIQNNNIGYRMGRLFAALEKIQQESHPGINATIRDKFYGAASSTPVTVFGNLMRLKNHHLAKLEYPGRKVFFEKLLGEIVGEISDFPGHLNLEDQGRFAIGYYHQTQDFFTKKDKNEQQ